MKRSDLICLYCGKQTTANEPSEHIFPENVGGDVKLVKAMFVRNVIINLVI